MTDRLKEFFARVRTRIAAKAPDRPTIAAPARRSPLPDCVHLGNPTGEQVACGGCGGGTRLKVFGCRVHGTCTIAKPAPGVPGCCAGCPSRTPAA